MKYFVYRWTEPPSDHAAWGASTWYFEVDDDTRIVGQWEVYDSGVILRYDEQHVQDEHGMLADQPFEPREAAVEGVRELDAAEYAAATAALAPRLPS